jgi:hypothetical protein
VRKHWRDTLTRLTDFLRLLDYIILELLRRLVKSSVRDLLVHIRRSCQVDFELNRRTTAGVISNNVDDDDDDHTVDDVDAQYSSTRNKSGRSSVKISRAHAKSNE